MKKNLFLIILTVLVCTTSFAQKENKYCYDDSYNSGTKYELILIDGGKAKIVIKNSDDKIIRTGEGSWSGTNDGPGGDAPIIHLKLSTGSLNFTAVVNPYKDNFSMLIDSKDNQWVFCY